ncbi:MAG: acyl carrier protein [Chthoniobacteraceae bacterium]
MTREQIIDLIISTVTDFLGSARLAEVGKIDASTRLFGREGILDSLGLVNLLLDIEQQVNEQHGLAIALADDRAMSQTRSPFRSVETLADYIHALAHEQPAA